jgi:hypothetical protein
VRSEIANSGSGRCSRSRRTIGAAASDARREPCQPSRRSARASAASELPPIQIGIGFTGFGCMRMSVIDAGM